MVLGLQRCRDQDKATKIANYLLLQEIKNLTKRWCDILYLVAQMFLFVMKKKISLQLTIAQRRRWRCSE